MLKLLVLSLLTGFSLVAQTLFTSVPLTGGTVSNVFSGGGYAIDAIVITSTTTNATTIVFYDSSSTATNYIIGAHTNFLSYSTNVSVTFTTPEGISVTNTYPGTYTYPVAVAAATNERPQLYRVIIPAGSTLSRNTSWLPGRGLTVLANYAATLQVQYRTQ